MMKKRNLLFCLIVLTGLALSAQTAWQEETVVRQYYQLSSTAATCATPQNEMLFLYLEDSYENRALSLQKYDSLGNPLWNEPRGVAGGMNAKTRYNIFAANDGNYFVIWSEHLPVQGNTMFLRKIDAQGNPLWQPENTQLDLPGFWSVSYLPDGAGGLYLLYDRYISGENWDIWGQHVNAAGIQLLPNQGVEITDHPLQENAAWCRAAANGTIMFGYSTYGGTFTNQHRILNLDPDFSINWSLDIDSGWTAQHSELSSSILSGDDTEFFFVWRELAPNASRLYLQRFNLDGETVFPQPLLLKDTDDPSIYSSAILTSDHNIMVSIHVGSNILPTQNYITKVDTLGSYVWSPSSVSLPGNITSMSALAADSGGGAYFTCKHIPNNENYIVSFSLQHVSSNGVLQFADLGVELTPQLQPSYQHSPRFIYLNGTILTAWMNRAGPQYGYYYNVRNFSGELIGEPLRTIVQGLYGYGDLRAVQARSDDVVVVWLDSRNVDSGDSPSQYWYQIVNEDGSEDLEPGGEFLFDYGDSSYRYIKTAYLENGNTLVIYSYVTNSASYIGGQLILPDGSLPWGPAGRTFHAFPYVYVLNLADVYALGNDVYLGWEMNYPGVVNANRVQKITDGEVQWGPEGISVDSGLPCQIMNEKLYAFRDGYVCLLVQASDPQRYIFWTTRLDASGALAAGWPAAGVVSDTLLYLQDSYLSYAAAESQDNLLLVNSYSLDDFGRYHYSILDPSGQHLVEDQVLFSEAYNQMYIAIDATSGFGLVAGISTPQYYMPSLIYNKLDSAGGFPWGNDSVQITPWTDSYTFDMARIHGFANGGYAVTYIQADKLYCNYINPDGSYQPLFEGEALSFRAGGTQLGSMLNDALYLTWEDFKYTTATTSIGEIRMQKLLNTTVAADDEVLPRPRLTLAVHPNPFRSSTTLCFDLPKAGTYELSVYNARGQLVKRIRGNAAHGGSHEAQWDGCDLNGVPLASGVYLVRVQADNAVRTGKITLIRGR